MVLVQPLQWLSQISLGVIVLCRASNADSFWPIKVLTWLLPWRVQRITSWAGAELTLKVWYTLFSVFDFSTWTELLFCTQYSMERVSIWTKRLSILTVTRCRRSTWKKGLKCFNLDFQKRNFVTHSGIYRVVEQLEFYKDIYVPSNPYTYLTREANVKIGIRIRRKMWITFVVSSWNLQKICNSELQIELYAVVAQNVNPHMGAQEFCYKNITKSQEFYFCGYCFLFSVG